MVQLKKTDVVISGIGGFFPRSVNLDQFKDLLLENAHIQDAARWKAGQLEVCDKTGNIPDIERFDASFFGIHRQQCTYMDPMQRLLLERTFEALIDAGVNPAEIRRKKVAVFVGSCVSENDSLMFESVENGFGITGQARTMLANRISYWLNITGPSCSIDCSWTNGTQLLQMALEIVRTGQCESAIIGCTNLALNIYPAWLYRTFGLTNMDGITKPFDDDADGYSRGESIVALYIQRADLCKRNYATIIHAETIFDGHRPGPFAYIDKDGLKKFLTEFYQTAGVDVNDVAYLETYGCGLKNIDESELNAIDEVFCKNRKTPLKIGSVKSNVGHTEAAEGFVSLVKTIIALETGTIPATLFHKQPNKNIPALTEGRVKVLTENTPWSGEYVAINSIGLSSSYGHALLKVNPKLKRPIEVKLPVLRTLSTRTEEGIKEIMKECTNYPREDAESTRLMHDVFKTSIAGHLYRGYVLHSPDNTTKEEFEHSAGAKRQIFYIYSGMGSQWVGMGKALLHIPIFANAIQKCHEILKQFNLDLMNIITTDDPKIFDTILHSFVGIAAIQIGLTDILKEVGIVPDGIIGHSVGELGCAYADGCLTMEQMILAAYYRGRASLDVELIDGMMAAVGLGADEVKKMCPPMIDVACHNGPDSSTLSGPVEEMGKFVAQLQEKGIFAKLVNVASIAYHSRYIQPAAPLLLKYLELIIPDPKLRSSKWICTSAREANWGNEMCKTVSAEYLTNNLLSSVYFAEGCKHIPANATCIEIAPHGLLQAILRRSLAAGCVNIPLTKRGVDQPIEFLLQALGKIYLSGTDLQLAPLYPQISYPVSRGTKSLAPLVRWEHSGTWRTGLDEFKDYSFTEKHYLVTMNSEEFRDLAGHCVDNRIVIPLAAYLLLVVDVLGNVKRIENATFENIIVKKHIEIGYKDSVTVTVMVQRGSGDFEVSEGQNVVAYGNIQVPDSYPEEASDNRTLETNQKLTKTELYEEFSHRGYEFGGLFENVLGIEVGEKGSRGTVEWKNSWPAFLTGMMKLQLLKEGEKEQGLLLPTAIRRIDVNLEHELQLENGAEIPITYHRDTGIISTPFAKICGIRFNDFPAHDRKISVNHFGFVPFSQGPTPDLRTGIDTAMALVLQNTLSDTVRVSELKDKFNPSLEKLLVDFFDNQDKKVEYEKKSLVDDIRDCDMAVLPEEYLKEVCLVLRRGVKFVLVRSRMLNEVIYPVVVASRFEWKDEKFCLLKKAENVNVSVVKIPEDYLFIKDLGDVNHMWVSEYMKVVKSARNANDVNKRVYLLSNVLPKEGLDVYLREAMKVLDMDYVRFAFVLDRSAPNFVPGEKVYDELFQRDVKVTVYKDEIIGTYVRTLKSLSTVMSKTKDNDIEDALLEQTKGNVNIRYISVDPREFSQDSSAQHQYVGYSGEMDDGTRVMGVGRLDAKNSKLIPDELLRWPFPHHWSLLDASTVPANYAMAYNLLVDEVNLEPGETLLIHDGCSGLGQALLSVAYTIGCSIFVTVTSDAQRAYIKDNFKFVSHHQILDGNDCSFEKDLLLATKGEGAHVIFNCYAGERFRATVRCLGLLSRIIHYRTNDINPDDQIGLGIFLRCIQMAGSSPQKVFTSHPELKTAMYNHILKGMSKSQIKPIERRLFQQFATPDILTHLNKPTTVGTAVIPVGGPRTKRVVQAPVYKCNKSETYLIVSDVPESYMDAAEWLTLRGAKHVTIVTKTPPTSTRRLQLLQKHHSTRIQMERVANFTPEVLSQIFRNVVKSTQIRCAIIVTKSDVHAAAYATDVALNVTCPKRRPMLIVLRGNANETKPYRSAGGFLYVCDVAWQQGGRLRDAFSVLDGLVIHHGESVLLDDVSDHLQEKLINKNDFTLLLPKNIHLVSDSLESQLELTQLTSACPRNNRETPPLFVIPGIGSEHCEHLQHLIRGMMYTIQCIKVGTEIQSIEKTADAIVKNIKTILPNGPFNLLAVSWAGALALEVVRRLENENQQTRLFLIDAVPDTIQAILSVNGSQHDVEVRLLTELLHLNDSKEVSKLSDWNSMLKKAFELSGIVEKKRSDIVKTIQHIRHQIDLIRNYKYQGKMINGPTVLFRAHPASSEDSFGLNNYCKQVEIKIVNGDHVKIMEDEELIEYINDNFMV